MIPSAGTPLPVDAAGCSTRLSHMDGLRVTPGVWQGRGVLSPAASSRGTEVTRLQEAYRPKGSRREMLEAKEE